MDYIFLHYGFKRPPFRPTVRDSIRFSPIATPILRSVDPVQGARFIILLIELERYEEEIQANQSELASLTALPYTASIDLSLRKNLLYMENLDSIAEYFSQAKELTNAHIKSYV